MTSLRTGGSAGGRTHAAAVVQLPGEVKAKGYWTTHTCGSLSSNDSALQYLNQPGVTFRPCRGWAGSLQPSRVELPWHGCTWPAAETSFPAIPKKTRAWKTPGMIHFFCPLLLLCFTSGHDVKVHLCKIRKLEENDVFWAPGLPALLFSVREFTFDSWQALSTYSWG